MHPITLLIVAGAITDWLISIYLVVAALEKPYIGVLVERAARSVTLAFAATIFAVLAVGDQFSIFDDQTIRALGGVAVLLISLYPFAWLIWWLRFRRNIE